MPPNSSPTLPLSGVPRTMLMTTRARAEEHQRDDGLFRDPTIAQWWPSLPWDDALDSMYNPIAQLTWAVRAHLFDQIVQRHLGTYADATVVELGAGLSTGNGARQLAKMGAPLKWLINTEADAAAMGIRLVEVRSLLQENCRYRDRIGPFRWVPWLSQLPPLRNAGLVIEARL